MKQLLDQKQKPRGIVLGIVENIFLPGRLFGRLRFERRPKIAGCHAVKPVRLLAETLAQSAWRQGQQAADGFDAELEQHIAERGLDVQAVEWHFARGDVFLGAIAKDRDSLSRLGDGIAAEARETDSEIGGESARTQIAVHGVSPLLWRTVKML